MLALIELTFTNMEDKTINDSFKLFEGIFVFTYIENFTTYLL